MYTCRVYRARGHPRCVVFSCTHFTTSAIAHPSSVAPSPAQCIFACALLVTRTPTPTPTQLVVFGGTTIVNGLMHYPKDIFSFDLGK